MVVGMDELDRLLGATPRLQLTGALTDGQIAVERAQLTGAKGSAAHARPAPQTVPGR